MPSERARARVTNAGAMGSGVGAGIGAWAADPIYGMILIAALVAILVALLLLVAALPEERVERVIRVLCLLLNRAEPRSSRNRNQRIASSIGALVANPATDAEPVVCHGESRAGNTWMARRESEQP